MEPSKFKTHLSTDLILEAWSTCWQGKDSNNCISITVAVVSVIVSLFLLYTWMVKNATNVKKYPLPPGPRGFPVIGNLPFVGPELPIYFARLTSIYGPVFKLKFGSKLCVVLGSSSSAKEALKDHDTIFSNRDPSSAIVTLTYGGSGIVWAPYGPEWRNLRRICVHEMLSKTSLESLYGLRRREVRRTIKFLYSMTDTPINVAHQMFLTSLNLIMNMLWGGALNDDEMKSFGKEFQRATVETVGLVMKSNVSDLFPILARFDMQRIEKRAKKLLLWFDRIFDEIINKRIKLNEAEGRRETNDLLDILLKLKEKGDPKTPITITTIKVLFQDLALAATDTTSTTVEWVMTEMINHPEIMIKVQEELGNVVGENNIVEESHIHRLTYLEAVIKETYRLHPVVPLLTPRRPSESCIIGGYTIPKGTQVLVNAWALQRDPLVWEKPLEFLPDRFLKSTYKWDYSGGNFNYLPFGAGRRMCAGISLAEKTVPYALASLLHSFNWKLSEGIALDLSATMGFSLRKTIPLEAIPTPRLANPELYVQGFIRKIKMGNGQLTVRMRSKRTHQIYR